ncbi:Membrane-associated tyrosine-and threonine-specific CDC2-inhibitory kinase [Entamoeba marina]
MSRSMHFFPTFISTKESPSAKNYPRVPKITSDELQRRLIPVHKPISANQTPFITKRRNHYSNMELIEKVNKDYIQRFTQLKKIGNDSIWDIYQVIDSEDKKEKILKMSHSSQFHKIFDQECRIKIIMKDDTYLLLVNSVLYDGNTFFSTMDMYKGTVLDLILLREMTEDEIIYTCWAILHALKMLNKNKYIHLNVKPENFFIDLQGRVKLGDFSKTKIIGSRCRIEDVGDSHYLSPEILQGYVTTKADIFSLGISIFEMSSRRKFPVYDYSFCVNDSTFLTFIKHPFIADIFPHMTNLNWEERLSADEFLEYSIFQIVPCYSLNVVD